MKKIIKTILMILTIILTGIFAYNYLTFNIEVWNVTFFLAIISAILTQMFCLNNFNIGKRVLFVLLSIALTFISFLIIFLIPGYAFPYSAETDINILSSLIGFLFMFLNFAFFYTLLMIFINKLKEKEKEKSSFAKLITIYFLVVTITETLIMIFINKS